MRIVNVCQSCGMPFDEAHGGLVAKEPDGRDSVYCAYCYQAGSFVNPNATISDMVEVGVPHLARKIGEEKALEELSRLIPTLKRWKTIGAVNDMANDMQVLFDETYSSDDGKRRSRNIWYGYADISVDGEYAKDIHLTGDFMERLCGIIKADLANAAEPAPTETNWYFYGKDTAQDAIGDNVRAAIMIREKGGAFVVNINLSDHDFAISIDEVLAFKAALEKRLTNLR